MAPCTLTPYRGWQPATPRRSRSSGTPCWEISPTPVSSLGRGPWPRPASRSCDGLRPWQTCEGAVIRTVSMLPAATEIVGALGLMDQLLAVSHECDFPAEANHRPRATF